MKLRGFFVYGGVWDLLGCSSVIAVKVRRYSVHGWQDIHGNFGLWHTEKSAVASCVGNRLTLAETGDFEGSLCAICVHFREIVNCTQKVR